MISPKASWSVCCCRASSSHSKVGRVLYVGSTPTREGREGREHVYHVVGQVFFSSADRFIASFDYKGVIEKVCIDVSRAHFWDITAVTALDKAVLKFRREGTEVVVVGLNQASRTMIDRFAVHDKPEAVESLMGH